MWRGGRKRPQAPSAAAGLVPGNRVLLTLPNGPDLAAALVGCWLAGGVAVPTPPLLRPAELARALGLTRAGFAIVDPGIEAGLAEAAALSGVAPRRVEPGTASGPCRPVDTAAEAPRPDPVHLRHDRPAQDRGAP